MDKIRIPWTRMIVQFVLILSGVVIAIRYVHWRESNIYERQALQMVLADLEEDSTELTALLNRGHTTERAVLWLLRSMDQEIPVDTVLSRMMPLFYYTSYEQRAAGYMGMRESGRLVAIDDPDVRQGVVAYFEETYPYMRQFHDMYMEIYREFKETTAPYLRLQAEPEGDVFVQSFRAELVRPWDEMKVDYRFRYKLEEIGGAGSQFAIRIATALEANGELRALIREELGITNVPDPEEAEDAPSGT